MTIKGRQVFWLVIVLLFCSSTAGAEIIIDHTCMDISQVPAEYIQAVKEDFSIHFAGRSHSYQVSGWGMGILSNNSGGEYYYVENNSGPPQLNNDRIDIALSLGGEYGIEPHEYFGGTASNVNWEGPHPIETYLDDQPLINVSVFCWCGELAAWLDNKDYVEGYLSAMNNLEQMYAPGGSKGRTEQTKVTFVYMTSHTQKHDGSNSSGTDREGGYTYLSNELIREFCRNNNKILFDFGDMDSWAPTDGMGTSMSNFDRNGTWELSEPRTISGEISWEWGGEPLTEVTFYPYHTVWGDLAAVNSSYHTREVHAQMKAEAFWWLIARLAGWAGNTPTRSSIEQAIKDLKADVATQDQVEELIRSYMTSE